MVVYLRPTFRLLTSALSSLWGYFTKSFYHMVKEKMQPNFVIILGPLGCESFAWTAEPWVYYISRTAYFILIHNSAYLECRFVANNHYIFYYNSSFGDAIRHFLEFRSLMSKVDIFRNHFESNLGAFRNCRLLQI